MTETTVEPLDLPKNVQLRAWLLGTFVGVGLDQKAKFVNHNTYIQILIHTTDVNHQPTKT